LLGSAHSDGWTPVGVIDFSDSRQGDPLFDLVSLHVDLLSCDEDYTLRSMKSYGMEYWNRKGFTYKMMCYTLLYPGALAHVWKFRPVWKDDVQSFSALQELLWGFAVQAEPDPPPVTGENATFRVVVASVYDREDGDIQ